MSEMLVNIYSRSIAIVLEIVETCFLMKNVSKSYIYVFFLSKNSRTGSSKTSVTQELSVIESCPTPGWVTFFIFYRLIFDISSHLNDMILAWSTSLQVSHQNSKVSRQNSRLVYKTFQFLRQVVSATWHADSDLVMIMQLKKKGAFVHVLFEPINFQGAQKFTFTWVGVRYNMFSITGSVNLFTWFVVDE